MTKKNKYLIARVIVMVLCVAIGFGMGWVSKKTETIEVKIETPIVKESEPTEESTPTYRKMDVVATAYCPCAKCCGKSDGITATGVKAKANHTIAADPSVLPYGTEIVCGLGEFVVEDCGGMVKGNKIDIFFNDHQEAVEFGVKELTIWVKEDVK